MMRTIGRGHVFPLALAGALQLLVSGCHERSDPNLAPGPQLAAGRNDRGEIEIRWSSAPPNARYLIYAGTSPDAIDRSSQLAELSAGSEARSVALSNIDPTTRHYYELVNADTGESRIVAERLLPLDGTHNFRDLGGYATRNGKRVRWGMLYRSDHLGDLDGDDLSYLEKLGIKLVCDFRSPQEREDHPDRLPSESPIRIVELDIADEAFDPDHLRHRLLTGDLEDIDLAQLLIDGNRKFATIYRDRYARLFAHLMQPGSLPALIHCSAGKDRTGFGAALILLALGVPEETVFDDFLLTNRYSANHIKRILTALRFFSLFRTDPDEAGPLLEVKREYLQAAFDAIREEYGSFDVYLDEELGVSAEDREALRARLLR